MGATDELTRLLVNSTSDGVLAFDTECRYTLWNPQMERISGLTADHVIGRVAFEVFPFLVETGEDQAFRDALAGRTVRMTDRQFSIPQAQRRGYFEGHYSPLRDDSGRVIGGVAIIRETTDRVARFEFLARASETLASSLDYEATLRQVAELTLPMLGDLCIIDIVEGTQLRRLATAHLSAHKAALLDELSRKYPAAPGAQSPAGRVLVSREPHLLRELPPEVIATFTVDEHHADLIRRLGVQSQIAVPLIARGATLGVISLAITESNRRYTEHDLSLAVDLARRAAVAIDNAHLYDVAQRELAQRRHSESRFRATTEQSPLSIQILAKDGTIAVVNKAWERLWGLTLEMVPGYNLLEDPQLEASGMLAYLRRAFAGEYVELPVHRYDPTETVAAGSRNEDPVRYLRTFAYPIKSAEGSVQEVALIQEDVTQRLRAEEQLRSSEERLRIATTGADMSVWEWDLATDRVESSANGANIWGVRVARIDELMQSVHPDDRAQILAARTATEERGAPYATEFRIVRGDATTWVHSRGSRVERNGRAYILGVTVDITQRKQAEMATKILADAGESVGSSLDLQRTLSNLCRVIVPRLADWCAIDLIDEAGNLERAAVFHEVPARVTTAMELFRRYPPRRDYPHGQWHAIETGKPQLGIELTPEMLAAAAHDPEHLELLRALGLRSTLHVPLIAHDRTIGALTLVHAESGRRFRTEDIALATDLARRAAAAVENAHLYMRLREEDRRKDEFLATLAHELRNPLAPLMTGVELMRLTGDTQHEKTRIVMERQLRHLVRLVDDLLDVSRVTRGKITLRPESLEVASVVSTAVEAARPLIEKAGLELSVSLPSQPLSLTADRTRIAQILSNLLNNAAKYTERGGKVSLTVTRDGEHLVLEVRDTGIGIPKEMQGQIFEMFVQVPRSYEQRQGGLGIGLTLVRRLVGLHGGQVWCTSDGVGTGSTFTVRLPNVHDAVTEQAPAARREPRKQRSVLLVDDNADVIETLSALLRHDGHDVRTAATGPDALEVVREFIPEIALLDIGLPGMSGYELARRLRDDPRLRDLTLVAVTGWGQPEDRRQSREAGFHHHFTKPVDARDLQSLFD